MRSKHRTVVAWGIAAGLLIASGNLMIFQGSDDRIAMAGVALAVKGMIVLAIGILGHWIVTRPH